MNTCLTTIGYAVADFLMGSTLLLLPVLWLLTRIKQPAYRLAAARATLVALVVFGTICFLPGWPRFSVRSADTTATVPPAPPVAAPETPIEKPETPPSMAWQPESHAVETPPSTAIELRNDAVAEQSQAASSTPVVETSPAAVFSPGWWPDVSGFAILAGVELLGVTTVGLWLAYGAAQTMLLCRRAVEASASLRELLGILVGERERVPRLLLSASVPNPVALGVLRPTIVLPQSADQDSHESLRSALAHEWAHIRNHDLRFLAVSRFLLVLLAIHPLYRFLCRRMREDQEALADAAASGQARREYAAELLRWARRAMEQPAVGAATLLGIWESKSQLSRRVTMLLDEQFRVETYCPRRWRWPWLAATAGVAACLSLATLRPLPASADVAECDAEAQMIVDSTQPKPAEKPSGETFTGTSQVIDAGTGKPIEGATVRVAVSRFLDSFPAMGDAGYRTDAHGRCTFTIPAIHATDPLLGVGIEISHPDYCTETRGEFLLDLRRHEAFGEPQRFERFYLARSESASGTLVTPDGKPAAGSAVRYIEWRPASAPLDVVQTRRFHMGKTVTDQQGRFRLDLARGSQAALLFMAEDYASQTHAIPQGHRELGQFALEKGGTVVKGRVLDESGKPVPEVWVTAMNEGLFTEEGEVYLRQTPTNMLRRQLLSAHPRSAMTDAQGEFALAPLAPGRYHLTVEDRQIGAQMSGPAQSPLQFTFLSQELTIEDNQAIPAVEIRAVPQIVVEGRYVGGQDRTKRDAWCYLGGTLPSGKHFTTNVRADRTGGFVLRAPKGLQQARLVFQADQYSQVLVRAHRGLPDRVEQDSGSDNWSHTLIALGTLDKDIRGIEVQWSHLPLVQLMARSEDGVSIKYLIVEVRYEAATGDLANPTMAGFLKSSGEPKGAGIVVKDRDDGRYCISGLLPDKEFTITIQADGYETRSEKLKLPEGAIKKLEVTLKKRPSQAGKKVVEVRVVGRKQFPLEKILSHLHTRSGQAFSPDTVKQDVRRLEDTHLFAHVTSRVQEFAAGPIVIFEVVERPLLEYVKCVGNFKVNKKKLVKESGLKPGDPTDPAAVDEGRKKIEAYYQSKGFAKAQVSILEGNKTNDRGAVFLIDEVPTQRLLRTKFQGNTFFSDEQLRAQVQSKPDLLWPLKETPGRNPLDEDVKRLIAFYRNHGCFEVMVRGFMVDFDENLNCITINFEIREGPRFPVRNISVTGNTTLKSDQLLRDLKLKPGQYFDQAGMNADKTAMVDAYRKLGYAAADAAPDVRFLESGKVDLVYRVTEGRR